MKDKNIRLEATGDFPFTFFIEKAVPIEEDGKLIVEGIASTLNVDHDNERMAKDALVAMARVINEKGVPLRMEHSKSDEAVLGDVYKAWVDERNQLWIRAAIDPAHDTGATVHGDMKIGKKYGLSVGGRVKNAVRELVESTGNYVKTFYDVILDEVSVTRRPANYDSWLFAKSIKDKESDVSPYYGSPLYKQFLFENPKYDYIDQFAKSVPAEAWKKVNKSLNDNNNDNMKDKEKKMKKADEAAHDQDGPDKDKKKDVGDGGTEKSYVTKSDFTKAMDMVAKGFKGLAGLITKDGMDSDAMDTANPDKKKEEVIGDKGDMKKGEREGQEDEGGNGSDEDGEREKSADDEEEKEKSADEEGEEKEKSEDDEDEKKEKSADDEEDAEKSEDDGEEKEKSEDDEDEKKEKGEKDDKDYSMKSMSDAIGFIGKLNKKMTGQKVTKSAKKEVAEGTIDEFAVEIAKSIDFLNEKFEKSGMRVPGLRDKMLDIIKNDAGIQSEIAGMMKQPGFKKSVSMGIPYMKDKDGRQYALMAKPAENSEIKKSMEGKSFKEVFKSKFSSYAQENGDNQ